MKNVLKLLLSLAIIIISQPITTQAQTLVWADEFNTDGLPDTTKWGYDVGGHGWGNNELQYYTDGRAENARVENGILIVEARKEVYEENNYTSARMVTRGDGDWLYGRVEVRAKLPYGRGTWAAIWMLPTDWAYGGWPHSGEIDIMEHVGYDQGNVHGSTHSLDYNFQTGGNPTGGTYVSDADNAFHIYAMEWFPDRIDVYVDNNLYFSSPNTGAGWEAWPFDKRFHLILNIAVGGDWGGALGVDEAAFPQRMEVDYVRVYDFGLGADDTIAPSTPQALTATAHPYALSVTWDHATDNFAVKDYIVYQDGTAIDTIAGNTVFLKGLQSESAYSFQVQARDFSDNLSAMSAVGTFQTTAVPVMTVPSLIEAESYFDWEGVQTEDSQDGTNVGWFDEGDWMAYRISVANSGSYILNSRIASALDTTLDLHITDDTGNILVSQSFAGTTGWQTWETVSSASFQLPAGTYDIYLRTATGGVNVNWIEFVEETTGVTIPGILEAEDYVNMSGVQLEATTDTGGGQNVGWLDAGDWLEYDINVTKAGDYTMNFRLASLNGGGSMDVYEDGQYLMTVVANATGGWQSWADKEATATLTTGRHILKLAITAGNFNINRMDFAKIMRPIYDQRIEAESYVSMSGVQLETTADVDGNMNVGWIDAGDWMTYQVNIATAGYYNIAYRIAAPSAGARLILSKNATDLASTTLPATGGWQNWQTVYTAVYLEAGQQTLALYAGTGGFNINWWQITSQATARMGKKVEEAIETEIAQVSIYPNPASNYLRVRSNSTSNKIRIFDLRGAELWSGEVTSQDGSIDIQALPSGTYIVQVQSANEMSVHKLIKR